MLINLKFDNLYSFADKIDFSLVAGNSRQHKNHVLLNESKYYPNILKSSIIYGANASGKSNIIKTIDFIKNFIIHGTNLDENIPRKYFKLDTSYINKPSTFEFEIQLNNKIYAYGAIFDSKSINKEWLIEIRKTSEKTLFERINKENEVKISTEMKFANKKDKQFFEFIAKGTRNNQLFLKECVDRNFNDFKNIFNWFKNDLIIIYPHSEMGDMELLLHTNKNQSTNYENFFEYFDLGISGINTVEIDIENESNFPKMILTELQKTLKNDKSASIVNRRTAERFRVFKNENEELQAFSIKTNHKLNDKDEYISFDLLEESDGTKRLIDILPGLMELLSGNKTFFIDELDRSLHPHLTRKFFEIFLNKSQTNSQLIATTHELNLLDLDLFRKDEIWFVEKDKLSSSQLYSLEEFKPRYDKDIKKGYLLGRFGAIPVVNNFDSLGWLK